MRATVVGVSKKAKRLRSRSSSFSTSRDKTREKTHFNTKRGTKDQKMRLRKKKILLSLELKRTVLLYAPYKFSTMRLCTLGSLKSRSICAFVRLLLPCNSSSSSSSSAKIRAVRNLSSMREDCGADFPPSVPEGFDLRARRRRPIVSIILSSSSVRRFLRPERKREETLCRCRRPDLNASADLSQNCIYENE